MNTAAKEAVLAEPWQALEAIGLLDDIEIEPATAALQLARLDAPLDDWHAASAHLSELAREAASVGVLLSGRSAEAQVGALAGLIHARFGYRGDSETYDDLDNANLIRVIERRRGLPVALGIVWLHCIRAAGWDGHGVDFPGHFLVALGSAAPAGRRERPARRPVVIDAFGGGATLEAADLLVLLQRTHGAETPLAAGMLRPMRTRDVLLRLQRNLVQRRRRAGALEPALRSLQGMLRIAPDEAANWLDAADLHRVLGQSGDVMHCLERFLALVPESQASSYARAQLDALRRGAASG